MDSRNSYQPRIDPGPDLSALGRYLLICCCVFLVSSGVSILSAPAQASHGNFRLQALSIQVAAGKSKSSSFGLDSCIDPVMAASSSSRSFRLQTGCGAAHSTRYFEEGIPSNSHWSLALLALMVLATTSLYLRGGNHYSG